MRTFWRRCRGAAASRPLPRFDVAAGPAILMVCGPAPTVPVRIQSSHQASIRRGLKADLKPCFAAGAARCRTTPAASAATTSACVPCYRRRCAVCRARCRAKWRAPCPRAAWSAFFRSALGRAGVDGHARCLRDLGTDAARMHADGAHAAAFQLLPQTFGPAAHAELGDVVRALAGKRDDAEYAGDVDDMSLSLLQQHRQEGLGAVDHAP